MVKLSYKTGYMGIRSTYLVENLKNSKNTCFFDPILITMFVTAKAPRPRRLRRRNRRERAERHLPRGLKEKWSDSIKINLFKTWSG